MSRRLQPALWLACVVALPALAGEEAANGIAWKTTWDATAKAAKAEAKPILVLITNPERCPPCRMMEEQTWPNPDVAAFVNTNLIPLKIHTGHSTERALAQEFNIRGIPTTLVIDVDKSVIGKQVGFAPPDDFLEFLESAASVQNREKAVKANPEDAAAALELARALIALDRKDEAAELLGKVIRLDKGNAQGKKVHALFLLGTMALENQKPDEAKTKFDEVLALDPKDEAGYADDIALKLALVPASKRDFAMSATRLQTFLKDFPKSDLLPGALFFLGRCHVSTGKNEKADKVLQKIIQEHPESPFARHAAQFREHLKRQSGGGE